MNIPESFIGNAQHVIYLSMVADGYGENEATWSKAGARLREEASKPARRGSSAARRYDNLHNEGGEGFSPYRNGR